MSLILAVAGATHLAAPELFRPAMPPYIPWHDFWILFTGIAEILAVLGLWIGPLVRPTSRLLALYFVAILPAHFHVALNDIPMFGLTQPWLWLRVPLQGLFVAWAWLLGEPPRSSTEVSVER